MKYIETVNKDCKHKDCIYRQRLSGNTYDSSTMFCNYIGIAGHSRGCKISECIRYKGGKRKIVNIGFGYKGVAFDDYEDWNDEI